MRTIEKIKVNHEAIEIVQALYEDYRAKQDLLTMIFELHKNDTDGSVIDSKPFETYEKKFMKKERANWFKIRKIFGKSKKLVDIFYTRLYYRRISYCE